MGAAAACRASSVARTRSARVLGYGFFAFDALADIHDEDEGRGRFVGGEMPCVVLGLPAGLPHGVVPRVASTYGAGLPFSRCGIEVERQIGGFGLLSDELLALQHEAAAAAKVHPAVGEGIGAGGNLDRELEGVAVGVGVRRLGDAEDLREADEEGLGIRALGGLGL